MIAKRFKSSKKWLYPSTYKNASRISPRNAPYSVSTKSQISGQDIWSLVISHQVSALHK